MKRDEINIEEVLKRSLPSASTERMESARERVFNYVQSDAAVEDNAGDDSDFKSVRSFGWQRLATITAVAALVVTAVWIGMGREARGVYARLETADGSLSRIAEGKAIPIRGVERIEAQEIVRSGSEGSALVLADGSRVEMRAHSELVLERANDGVRIRLNNGDVIVSAAKQHGHLYVQTKDVTVSVVGTVFLVKAEETGSRVAVIEGEVHVRQGETDQKLKPGDQVKTNPLMESQPVSQEIAWSSRAPEHMALLQQSTAPVASVQKQLAFEVASIKPEPPAKEHIPQFIECHGIDGSVGISGGRPGNFSQSNAPQGRCIGRNQSLGWLIIVAYGLDISDRSYGQLAGLPDWEYQDFFEIDAKADNPAAATKAQLLQMLQASLAERFKLRVSRRAGEDDGYVLSLGRGGLKLKEALSEEPLTQTTMAFADRRERTITGKSSSKTFADFIGSAPPLLSPVLDSTGLKGTYVFNFSYSLLPWRPAEGGGRAGGGGGPESGFSALQAALQEQLGLRLERGKVPAEFIVVEHAEKPSKN